MRNNPEHRCTESMNTRRLMEGIESGNIDLAVIGSGYVGLTTAALFAEAGFCVTAVDKRSTVVKALNSGRSSIHEAGLCEIIRRNTKCGRLTGSQDMKRAVSRANAILIAVQTQVDSSEKPDLSVLSRALSHMGRNFKRGALIVVISTVPIGAMSGFVKKRLESSSQLKAESDFLLAYSPERMSPGNAVRELHENTRIVGGIGPNSTEAGARLFRKVCKRVIETDVKTAEASKLAENAYRNTNIAFANQLALICERAAVDSQQVIRMANTHPRVKVLTPGPGVGGPCLRKDSLILAHGFESDSTNLIRTATILNSYMANHVVEILGRGLVKVGKDLGSSRIAILGTAYKRDTDDTRESPSKRIVKELIASGASVTSHDPNARESFGAQRKDSVRECVTNADGFVVVTDHSEFMNLNLSVIRKLMNDKPVIVDTRRIIDPCHARRLGFEYYGIGLGSTPPKKATG